MARARFTGRRRALSLFSVVAIAAAFALVLASPALAQPPISANNFNPNQTTLFSSFIPGEPDTLILSDKFDGVDQLAHITSVATQDATQAIYVICGAGGPPPFPAPFPPPGCQEIGRDTVGVVPVPGGFVGTSVDKAFQLFWDVPSTFDGIARDFISYHCVGEPLAVEPGGHCLAELEGNGVGPRVILDDAQTSTNSSSGEFVSWCVDQPPVTFSCTDGTGTVEHPLPHGAVVPAAAVGTPYPPGSALIVTARVSSDVDLARVCVDFTADAFFPPNGCALDLPLTQVIAAPAFSTMRFAGPLGALPLAGELAFILWEADNSFAQEADNQDGFCGLANRVPGPAGSTLPTGRPDCVLDVHYAISARAQAAQVHLHNDEVAEGIAPAGLPHNDDPTTFCEDANRKKGAIVPAGVLDQVIGCIFDQFAPIDTAGNKDLASALANVSSALEITGPAATPFAFAPKFFDCEGTLNATATRCDFDDLQSANHAADKKYEAQWASGVIGTVTITFCVDPEHDGCANAGALVDTVTKTVVPGPKDHVHLRQAADVDADPTCHTGTANTTADTSATVNLTGCVFDAFHNPIADDNVIWRLETTGLPGGGPGGDDPARFVNFPEQSTDVNGQADASVRASAAAAGHLTNVFFCNDNNLNGICDLDESGQFPHDDDFIALFQIQWRGPACIRGTAHGDVLRGTAGPDCIRGLGGADRIFGGRGGDDIFGGFGNDVIHGGPGNDNIIGGPGFDVCFGRGGNDSFVGCEKEVG